MSVSYTKVAGTNLNGDVVNFSSDSEAEGLINVRTPSAVKIETYIPPKKRTLLFDIGWVDFTIICIWNTDYILYVCMYLYCVIIDK